ncbi:PLP-dependent aminotransferase family protein [Bacillus mexicanus]|uniref:aminotransferase-like domain-containing protein n=1 Tax=Bacillus mexicanus TaxID=2834415 RepID=UPI003D1E56B7
MKDLLSLFSLQTQQNAIDSYMEGIKGYISNTNVIPLSIGLPNKQLLQKEQFLKHIQSLFDMGTDSFFNYGGAKGLEPLISTISKRENIAEDHIMITTGNTQGVELSSRLLLNPKDSFAFEQYTYSQAHSISQQYQLNAFEIPLYNDGLDIEYLENTLSSHTIKALYIIPNAQNPTGITTSLEKRKKLIELAYRYNFMILEDDPYRDLIFDERLPSLFELDTQKEKVIYMHSFSKTIAPTLRTGFILAHPSYIEKLKQFKQSTDSCTSPLNQMIVYKFLQSDEWEISLEKQRSFYESRKNITKKFINRMSHNYNWTGNEPKGGLFYWVDTNTKNVQDYLTLAAENGVIFIPGNAFSLNDSENTKFRLCFSYVDNKDLATGFERLEETFTQWKNQNQSQKINSQVL